MHEFLGLRPARNWRKLLLLGAIAFLFFAAAASGTFVALYLFESGDIPDVSQLEENRPSIITSLHAADGSKFAEFAQERRIVVDYRDIPTTLRQAIVAVEDADFYEHHGLNLRGILRAAVENAKQGRIAEGGSSLTQQLAKLMFLTPEKSLRRKVREAIVALHIERTYSKEEILAFYLNQIYLGHNRYGVEGAALLFFDKHVKDLTLGEAALIAGLPQRPNAYSPYREPVNAKSRRDHVLSRMEAEGFITATEAETARSEEIHLRPYRLDENDIAPHFVEEVRRKIEEQYGERALYHDGLVVRTTVDLPLSQLAERALRGGLLALDKRRGWRKPTRNLVAEGSSLQDWRDESWDRPLVVGQLVPGVVMSVRADEARVRVRDLEARVSVVPTWTRRRRMNELLTMGDIAHFRVEAHNPEEHALQLEIDQEPEVEGGIVAFEAKTGRVLAMVGGWDFRRSRFNRVTQALRQTGSSFKPILYATAIENGFTAADTLFDEPIAITDPTTGKIYSPENYGKSYYGLTTVREALEKSRNPVSVQILQRVGAHTVIDASRRLGITAKLEPYPSLALGAFEVSLMEMTTAFAAFADQGVLHDPFLIERIEDRDGHPLYSRRPVSRQALSPEAAYVMTHMLQGVVQYGTARSARSLGEGVAGKTGTTDDFTDAWFIGYSPSIVCGVWVGLDRKLTLGEGEVGAKAALPIWLEFMSGAIARTGEESFQRPPGIELVTIDKNTGLRATAECARPFSEAFVRGTAPVTYCSAKEHEIRALPYYLQKIFLAGGTPPPLSGGMVPTASSADDEVHD